jgi:hypothetical protein
LYDGRRRRVAQLARDLSELSTNELDHLTHATEILERITGRAAASLGATARPESGARGASPGRARRRKR